MPRAPLFVDATPAMHASIPARVAGVAVVIELHPDDLGVLVLVTLGDRVAAGSNAYSRDPATPPA